MLQKYNPKNENIWIFVSDKLFHRKEAKISVFDSVVQGGDAVWEGLRLYNEGILHLDRHLDRLFDSAKAMHFQNIPDREFIMDAIRKTLVKNGMEADTHIRLTLTRGEKITSGMDPRLNQKGCTLIVLAEWKAPVFDNKAGIKIVTSAIRRNSPAFLDSKIHHNNLINNILAKIQANIAGADAALMLDFAGFAAELNDTNIFHIKGGKLYTPFADACLHGVTRGFVLDIAQKYRIPFQVKNISLTELYSADMVFCSGTMGELTPIVELDGRQLPRKNVLFDQLLSAYRTEIPDHCIALL